MTAVHRGFVTIACQTLSGSGSITATGVKIDDKVMGIWNLDSNQWAAPGSANQSGLEAIITVDDQIQQTGAHWATGSNILVLLLRE